MYLYGRDTSTAQVHVNAWFDFSLTILNKDKVRLSVVQNNVLNQSVCFSLN